MAFVCWFLFGPLIAASIGPTFIFGILLGQWGSNLIWGSVFGLGWCLAAFATGWITHSNIAAWIGLAWAWGILVPFYLFARWLWVKLPIHGRKVALVLLFVSFLPIVPAKTLMAWDEHGVHLPDFGLHANESY